ncbi:MAG: ribosomal protein S18-alanine N-acetyltransferase [Myxococcaceae bacterium]
MTATESRREAAPLHIRRLDESDFERLVALERDAFSHPWSPELLRRELTHTWSTILVAEAVSSQPLPKPRPEPLPEPLPKPLPKPLIGALIYWRVHDEMHILNVAVAQAARRQGIATQLIERGLEAARASGCVLATLEVRRSNVAAVSLYQRFGFRTVGSRPNYYVDEREDALVMTLDFPKLT